MDDESRSGGARGRDAIVVLGARVGADGAPSPALARRVRRGAALFHEGRAPWLLLSGGRIGERPAEAEVMRALALAAGVAKASILLEAESRSTWENALFTERLMAGRGLASALLVTDRLHLPRALLSFRRVGLKVEGRAAEESWSAHEPGRFAAQALYEAGALLAYLPRLIAAPPG